MTTKQHIINYLKQRPGWCSGTELESFATDWATKSSVISRRARELAYAGQIERVLSFSKTVQYRLPEPKMTTKQANSFLRSLPTVKPQEQVSLI